QTFGNVAVKEIACQSPVVGRKPGHISRTSGTKATFPSWGLVLMPPGFVRWCLMVRGHSKVLRPISSFILVVSTTRQGSCFSSRQFRPRLGSGSRGKGSNDSTKTRRFTFDRCIGRKRKGRGCRLTIRSRPDGASVFTKRRSP